MHKALILVDIQNDFLPGGALAVKEGDQIISRVNKLMDAFEIVLATKDWHPVGHYSFADTHGKQVGEKIELATGYHQQLWPVHCIQEDHGSEFPPSLHQKKITKVFFKGADKQVDSYSGFFDNHRLRSTGLAEYLREKGVEEVYLVGLATDYCIKYTALDARGLGFNIFVIIDCCRGIHPKQSQQALEEMRQAGVNLIDSQLIIE